MAIYMCEINWPYQFSTYISTVSALEILFFSGFSMTQERFKDAIAV